MNTGAKAGKAEARIRKLRAQIDALDEKIQALVTNRARRAQEIAKTKQLSGTANFYRPEREAEVLRRALARNRGPLTDEAIARLFREIMSACLALESELKIAFTVLRGPSPRRPPSNISAMPSARARWARSTRYSARSNPTTPISGWCRWRIPPKA
jgi:chorismate mutase-like protein